MVINGNQNTPSPLEISFGDLLWREAHRIRKANLINLNTIYLDPALQEKVNLLLIPLSRVLQNLLKNKTVLN